MSFNGNGTFFPPAGQPVATGTVIQSSTFNVLVADIGNTFNNVLPRDGQASMSGQLKLIDGTSAVPGIAFNSEASTGIFRPSAGVMALTVSGVEALRVNNSGRMLVGTVTDDGTSKLQVTGAAKITGALTATSFVGPLTGAATSVSGVVAIANGGTGAATLPTALAALGLNNLDNTSDLSKPLSTAAQTAINLKANSASPTLTAPTITDYTETTYVPAAGSAFTVVLSNGTLQKLTTTANATITLPASVAGKSYSLLVAFGGAHTLTFSGGGSLRWAGGAAPPATSVSGKVDIFVFTCDGTFTYARGGGSNY